MTTLFTTHPEYFNDICEAIRLFIDTRRIELLESPTATMEGSTVLHTLGQSDGVMTSTARFFVDGICVAQREFTSPVPGGVLEKKREAKRACKISVYRALLCYFQTPMPWGSLTGIRPTKLLRDSEALLGTDQAKSLFVNTFDVSPQKYALAKAIVDAQSGLNPKNDELDVYIGIPFCVTRCAYCSFASYTPDVFKDAEAQYVSALLNELACAEEIIGHRRVRALYVGGGTPTALSLPSFEKVLSRASELACGTLEFTVEAGRPDTITEEKLALIKASGARRLSVNAQTMFDETLQRIGRRHTAAAFLAAYELAAKAGFDAINVDLIVGLPGETESHIAQSLSQVIDLRPSNITVHTLAVKRASAFAAANMGAFPTDTQTAQAVEKAHAMLAAAGYHAYYMYRQKYMKGSLENAGYTLPGHACLYNIDNMEELCDVLAFGAGAISKRLFNGGARIERAANVKDLKGYIERYAEMADAKRKLFVDDKKTS
jgi:oxygen-independent coproporphyrinogen-3 oxidase